MRTVIVGAVESTRVALQTIASTAGWSVSALVTLPPDLAGRHADFVDLAADAGAAHARVIHAANCNAPAVLEVIRAIAPDYVFVIGWSQICRPAFFDAAGGRVIGYHPAPLPRLRGRAVIPWTILLDEKITAATLFWADDGIDTGPLLMQRFFHIAPDETAGSLYARHMDALRAMLPETLALLADGRAPCQAQDERYATWAAKRTPADGTIDWARPATDVWRLIRAVGRPYPGAFTHAGDERLVIWNAEVWLQAARHAASPGQVVAHQDGGLVICCGDGGAIKATEWQTESGRLPRLHSRLGKG